MLEHELAPICRLLIVSRVLDDKQPAETLPLPTSTQFLNVIESVFSGMARAVLHNSDYATLEDAQAAVTRYFEERNDAFRREPRRAGRTIWGMERVLASFIEANNCKDSCWLGLRCRPWYVAQRRRKYTH